MKKLFCIFLILTIFRSAWAIREVEFEWEEVEDAKHYQVEIRNEKGFTKTLTSNSPSFKVKNIAPGKYQIRGQVHAKGFQEKLSKWSDWKAFDVPPTPSQFVPLKITEYQIAPGSFISQIPLVWMPVEGAAEYILEVFDSEGKSHKKIFSKKPEALLELRPGTYSCTITTKTEDGLESEAVSLNEKIFIQKNPIEVPHNVVLNQKDGTISFLVPEGIFVELTLERRSFLGSQWEKVEHKELKEYTFKWSQRLRPGKYRAILVSKNAFNEFSKPFIKEFIVKPDEADLQ